ncbi:MAG: M48 family metallopeptidase [Candidatus Omnitrophota bacterium]
MLRPLIFASTILLLSGCASVYNPATGKHELVFIDTGSEVALGKSLDRKIRQESKVVTAVRENQRVKDIGRKISAVCDRSDLQYQFYVLENKELNAFSVPGGFVYVNTGLLKKANDSELAGVIAHEIAHVVARHSVKHLQAALGFNILMSVAFNQSDAVDLYRAANVIYNLVSLGYSREDERQADKLAVSYVFKAGYDPQGMLSFFAKIKEEEKENGVGNIPVFLRSHPAVEERIANIKKEIASLK